ncbi:uncharacterized protein LOC132705812 isoform X2 [Cylas formicarius]|uniref:uncharacterized protein LOC132705812 isoform X2 n=1 Tax=Cylas formicarius TaxID=197179 RepID=UPI002958BA3F|nr:uncharacterized protein LOC132705812 isoform X2 [Cylas formicarius]
MPKILLAAIQEKGITKVSAIQCYKCILAPYIHFSNETLYKCKDIDFSDKFMVDCPFSTFCMKKVTSAKIPALINGVERNCAYQKLETQRVENGKWHPEVRIEEPYEEGCFKINDKGLRTSTIEYCYCKGNLCNGAGLSGGYSLTFIAACSILSVILTRMSFY